MLQYNLYYSPFIRINSLLTLMSWAGSVRRMRYVSNAYIDFLWKAERGETSR
jgi:hypothetical protein